MCNKLIKSIFFFSFQIIQKEIQSEMVYAKKKSYSLTEMTVNSKSFNDNGSGTNKENHFISTNEVIKSKSASVTQRPFLGIFYTFLTSVNFLLASVMVKKLPYIDIGQLSFVRNAGVFVGTLPVAVYCSKDIFGKKEDRRLLLTRGIVSATALYLLLTAYRYLPLAEAAIIMSSSPALTNLVAHFYLKEPCSVTQVFCLVLTITGVLTSVRLPELLSKRDATHFGISYIGGLAAATMCVLTISFTFVTMRKMKDIHFSIPTLYLGFFGMIENATINAVTSSFVTPFCGWDLVMYVLIASLGFVSNCTFILSIQTQAAGIVSVVDASMDIIVAMCFQIIFFNEFPDVYKISGACLVITSVTLIGLRNWLLMQPENSKTRKKLRYFLL